MPQAVLGVIGLGILGLLGYGYYDTTRQLEDARTELAIATEGAETLRGEMEALQADKTTLEEELAAERDRSEDLEEDVGDLRGTVRELDKIVKTDPELLQKYSKVYFLNENYSPAATVAIPDEYIFGPKDESIHAEVLPYLKDLLEDAKEDETGLLVSSGFRSFETQAALKSGYRVTYGSGANAFSADQGYSEHQLGTTVDFTTEAVGGPFMSFAKTGAYNWLLNNAYRYGFILSYPPNNSYYQYEPWHWRFVGKELARDLHREGKNFYDLDQREIDKYLGEIFE